MVGKWATTAYAPGVFSFLKLVIMWSPSSMFNTNPWIQTLLPRPASTFTAFRVPKHSHTYQHDHLPHPPHTHSHTFSKVHSHLAACTENSHNALLLSVPLVSPRSHDINTKKAALGDVLESMKQQLLLLVECTQHIREIDDRVRGGPNT